MEQAMWYPNRPQATVIGVATVAVLMLTFFAVDEPIFWRGQYVGLSRTARRELWLALVVALGSLFSVWHLEARRRR